jgi:H+/Cl- antiporter ClcA
MSDGGVLFSLEEASSFFAHKMLFKTLTATVLATFCIAIYHGNLLEYSALQLTVAVTPNELKVINRLIEIPFYIFVGACGGLLGAAFNGTCL